MPEPSLRLVQDAQLEEAIRLSHAGAAGFLSALLSFEARDGATYDNARKLEEWANGLVDVAAILVKKAEEMEAPHEPGQL